MFSVPDVHSKLYLLIIATLVTVRVVGFTHPTGAIPPRIRRLFTFTYKWWRSCQKGEECSLSGPNNSCMQGSDVSLQWMGRSYIALPSSIVGKPLHSSRVLCYHFPEKVPLQRRSRGGGIREWKKSVPIKYIRQEEPIPLEERIGIQSTSIVKHGSYLVWWNDSRIKWNRITGTEVDAKATAMLYWSARDLPHTTRRATRYALLPPMTFQPVYWWCGFVYI